jgi:hypothetical protein
MKVIDNNNIVEEEEKKPEPLVEMINFKPILESES